MVDVSLKIDEQHLGTICVLEPVWTHMSIALEKS